MISRRAAIQIGCSGMLGVGLPQLFAGRARAAVAAEQIGRSANRPKSVVIVFLTGAASHHDTLDMKPEAPAEVRGEFKAIDTSVPGIQICEHLPRLAARAQRCAIVRSMTHGDNNHLMSTHHVLTGHLQPGAFFDKVASRDDWPSYSAACDYLRPRHDGIPTGVNLPTFLSDRVLTWPGQHAGLLGPRHDPWQITGDPNKPDFRVDSLHLAKGIELGRLEHRQSLLADVNRQQAGMIEASECRRLSDEQQLAFTMLTSSKLTQAFELDREPAEVRDRYGRHTYGQSLLLARRLVQVGVPVVQANMGSVQSWDHHGNIFPMLKRMLPPLDQGVAALIDDLGDLGLLDQTLVVMVGEFGRTPKINAQAGGRDHWGPCFSALFAGGGVQGGQVVGKSDKIGAYPLSSPFSPDDLGATILRQLGVDPASEIRDRQGRPLQLNRGTVMQPLFNGAPS
ncbi:MAG TPA: DUF1501 domain-containing protein [Pirellulales bacterium]|nr:DUF1501 domain-containing protein [Pirellulales bacterium]